MSWSERYAIPGIYFVLLVAAFYWTFFGSPFNKQTIFAALVVAVSASLPAGYILSIISQRTYYWWPPSWQLNRKSWRQAGKNQFESKIQPESKGMSEEIVEAEAAVLGRWMIESDDADKGRWLQEWFSKRMDVLAINRTLIIATIIGWIMYLLFLVVFLVFYYEEPPMFPTFEWWRRLVPHAVITFLIIWALISSTRLLNKKLEHALTKFFSELTKNMARRRRHNGVSPCPPYSS